LSIGDRPYLDAEMAQLIARMSVMSEVSAAGYQPTGRSGATDSGIGPSGTGRLMAEDFARSYGKPFHVCTAECKHTVAETDDDRRGVIERAREAIAQRGGHVDTFLVGAGMRARVSDTRPDSDEAELLETLKREIVEHGEGWSVRELAVKHRCAERIVIKARKDAGREPEFGKVPEFEGGRKRGDAGRYESDKAARDRVLELDQQGMRIVQIAMLTGLSRSTVERYLGRRAA
jgi:hypothetical protein